MRPEALRVSVREGRFYARFDESAVFSLDAVKEAVRRAGLTYRQTELVARGRPVEMEGESGLLLTDEAAEMTLLLAEGDNPAVLQTLRTSLRSGELDDTVIQVLGNVLETGQAEERARAAGANLVVTVERFAPADEAPLPPVYAREAQEDASGWFQVHRPF